MCESLLEKHTHACARSGLRQEAKLNLRAEREQTVHGQLECWQEIRLEEGLENKQRPKLKENHEWYKPDTRPDRRGRDRLVNVVTDTVLLIIYNF